MIADVLTLPDGSVRVVDFFTRKRLSLPEERHIIESLANKEVVSNFIKKPDAEHNDGLSLGVAPTLRMAD